MMEVRSFEYDGLNIQYIFTEKKVKNINIRINSEGQILVSASSKVSRQEIESFMYAKADWIFLHLAKVEKRKMNQPDSEIYSDKQVYFLGKLCMIKMYYNHEIRIRLIDHTVEICSPFAERSREVKELYLIWLKKRCYDVFDTAIDRMLPLLQEYRIRKPEFYVRNMSSRWGSCIPSKGRIGLNLQLMKTSEACIDYVVLHELLHFIYRNHGNVFYSELGRLMPDWKVRRSNLELNFKDGI